MGFNFGARLPGILGLFGAAMQIVKITQGFKHWGNFTNADARDLAVGMLASVGQAADIHELQSADTLAGLGQLVDLAVSTTKAINGGVVPVDPIAQPSPTASGSTYMPPTFTQGPKVSYTGQNGQRLDLTDYFDGHPAVQIGNVALKTEQDATNWCEKQLGVVPVAVLSLGSQKSIMFGTVQFWLCELPVPQP